MSVIKGSPAELSGIKEGDVITAFDNTNITSFKEFRKLLYTKNVGDVVSISYERAGKNTTVNVVLQ